jgi:hypothetical protein
MFGFVLLALKASRHLFGRLVSNGQGAKSVR